MLYKLLSMLLILFLVSCTSPKNNVSAETQEDDLTIEEMKIVDNKNLEIYITNDIHYLGNSINDRGESFVAMDSSSDGRQIKYIDHIVNALSYDIQNNNPNILIVSGDLTHNGEKSSHEELSEKFKKIESYGTEVFVIPGNHDIKNPWAREFKESEQLKTDNVTPQEFEQIYNEFGYNSAISRDNYSLSYLASPSENLWLLMLDTSVYDDNKYYPTTNGVLKEETLNWIKECAELGKNQNVEILTVMHHNLYDHSDILNEGFTIDNKAEVLEVFKELDLNLVFSGHIHIQDIKTDETSQVFDIANSALIVYPIQYGVLNYAKDNGFKYKTEKVNVEKYALDNSIKDENLINFFTYAKDEFYNKSYMGVHDKLIENGYSEFEAKEMSEVFANLNNNYFAGTVEEVAEEVKSSNGYSLWLAADSDFFNSYILSMLKNATSNHAEFSYR